MNENYYLLNEEYVGGQGYVKSCNYDLSEINPNIFWQGENVDQIDAAKISFDFETMREMPAWMSNSVSWPMIRNDLLDKLDSNVNEWAQILQVNSVGLRNVSYSLLNLTKLIPALNLDLSEYRKSDLGNISAVHRYVLNRKYLCDAPPLFRLEEYRYSIFVSASFLSAIEPMSCWGCTFARVDIVD